MNLVFTALLSWSQAPNCPPDKIDTLFDAIASRVEKDYGVEETVAKDCQGPEFSRMRQRALNANFLDKACQQYLTQYRCCLSPWGALSLKEKYSQVSNLTKTTPSKGISPNTLQCLVARENIHFDPLTINNAYCTQNGESTASGLGQMTATTAGELIENDFDGLPEHLRDKIEEKKQQAIARYESSSDLSEATRRFSRARSIRDEKYREQQRIEKKMHAKYSKSIDQENKRLYQEYLAAEAQLEKEKKRLRRATIRYNNDFIDIKKDFGNALLDLSTMDPQLQLYLTVETLKEKMRIASTTNPITQRNQNLLKTKLKNKGYNWDKMSAAERETIIALFYYKGQDNPDYPVDIHDCSQCYASGGASKSCLNKVNPDFKGFNNDDKFSKTICRKTEDEVAFRGRCLVECKALKVSFQQCKSKEETLEEIQCD